MSTTKIADRQLFTPPGGGVNVISNTDTFNFGNEDDEIIKTISNISLTNTNIKSFTYIPILTTETSLTDFKLNGVIFNIENIINNTSFDIRGTALNGASGIYTINYKITY